MIPRSLSYLVKAKLAILSWNNERELDDLLLQQAKNHSFPITHTLFENVILILDEISFIGGVEDSLYIFFWGLGSEMIRIKRDIKMDRDYSLEIIIGDDEANKFYEISNGQSFYVKRIGFTSLRGNLEFSAAGYEMEESDRPKFFHST